MENTKKVKIEFSAQQKEQPFENVSDEDFVKVEDILGKTLEISEVKTFENDSGPGAYALFEVDGKKKFICTHSKPLVAGFARMEKLLEVSRLENEGEPYCETKIVKRQSKTDAGKQVYSFA